MSEAGLRSLFNISLLIRVVGEVMDYAKAPYGFYINIIININPILNQIIALALILLFRYILAQYFEFLR